MIISTTPQIEGQRITEYKGVVSGDAILGANVFKDMFAGIRDIVGGRSASYERELAKAKGMAMAEMKRRRLAWEPTPWWVSISTTRPSDRTGACSWSRCRARPW